ncbi:sigma-70 family RNA polymerase sigma factor [Devosia sp.]|uniref:sigma-70 family RNA polymerase sigma factor n=1 Tax=Devosia sp. TaxID=1871048 RepID=UPI003FA59A26
MMEASGQAAASAFEPIRPRLLRVAYRMLGSVADAEDVVQEAFIRWLKAERDEVREPEGFLIRTVTRLCLDVLKSARHRRETYIGPWLPEPVVEAEADMLDDDVTLPLLLALERLSPLERAAFLLHDVFGVGFAEIGETIGKDPAACRQLASRARNNVRAARPRFPIAEERSLAIAEAFFDASRSGDMSALRALLAADVVVVSDGGGKRPAATQPILGLEAVMALHAGLAQMFADKGSSIVRYGIINGLPGFISEESDGWQTTALLIEEGQIKGIYIVRNPDKLGHLTVN